VEIIALVMTPKISVIGANYFPDNDRDVLWRIGDAIYADSLAKLTIKKNLKTEQYNTLNRTASQDKWGMHKTVYIIHFDTKKFNEVGADRKTLSSLPLALR